MTEKNINEKKRITEAELNNALRAHVLYMLGKRARACAGARLIFCDLDLRGFDLGGLDLREAIFINCDFGGEYVDELSGLRESCGFAGAILQRARFENCSFGESTSFKWADVDDVCFMNSAPDAEQLEESRGCWFSHT